MAVVSKPIIWTIATLGAVSFLTAYCQVHSWIDGVETAFVISFRWGLLAGLTTVIIGSAVWHRRALFVNLSAASLKARSFASIGFALAALAIGGVVHSLASTFPIFSERISRHIFDLLPLAAALGIVTMVALSLIRSQRQLVPENVSPPSWITMPEDPMLKVRPLDVQLVRSAGNYCEFIGDNRNLLVRVPLKTVAARLKSLGFVQIHRTVIINSNRVRTVAKDNNGCLGAYLDTGTFVPVSRGYKNQLDDLV